MPTIVMSEDVVDVVKFPCGPCQPCGDFYGPTVKLVTSGLVPCSCAIGTVEGSLRAFIATITDGVNGSFDLPSLAPNSWQGTIGTVSIQEYNVDGTPCTTPIDDPFDRDVSAVISCAGTGAAPFSISIDGFQVQEGVTFFAGTGALNETVTNGITCDDPSTSSSVIGEGFATVSLP